MKRPTGIVVLLVAGCAAGALIASAGLAADDAKPKRLGQRVDDLAARIDTLERRLDGQTAPKPSYHGNVIQAQRFEVVNDNGKLVAVLATAEDLPAALVLCDANANPRVLLSVEKDGQAYVQFADEKHMPRLILGMFEPSKGSGLLIQNAAGQKVVDLSGTGTGTVGGLRFYGADGAIRTLIGLNDDLPIISTWKGEGELIWFAPAGN